MSVEADDVMMKVGDLMGGLRIRPRPTISCYGLSQSEENFHKSMGLPVHYLEPELWGLTTTRLREEAVELLGGNLAIEI